MEKVAYCLNHLCLSHFRNYHPLRRIITCLLITGEGGGGGGIGYLLERIVTSHKAAMAIPTPRRGL